MAFVYGTPKAHPVTFAEEIKEYYNKICADSAAFICVDPNTNNPCTEHLDPKEAGFSEPDHTGSGWNAKIYHGLPELRGKIIAGMHKYCGSASTNLNGGNWLEDVPLHYVESAIRTTQKYFPGHVVDKVIYDKPAKEGTVPTRLQDLTRTQYAPKLREPCACQF